MPKITSTSSAALCALLILASLVAARPGPTGGENNPTPPATPSSPSAPHMKYTVCFGEITMTQSTAESNVEDYAFRKAMMAAQGQDTSGFGASPGASGCSECAGVKQSITQFLGDAGSFKIRDQKQGSHFQIDGVIINKAESSTSTTANSNSARGRLRNLPGGIGGLLGGSEVATKNQELRMDVAVTITNLVTRETRSHQVSGSASAKDLGIDVEGFFQVGKDKDPNIAIACADAAKQAALWLNQTAESISDGLEFWADVVRVQQNAAKKDSLVMINLGKVDGVVPGLVFAVGDTFSIRPGIWEIEQAGLVETQTVEDFYSWAVVKESSKAIKARVMAAKLRN